MVRKNNYTLGKKSKEVKFPFGEGVVELDKEFNRLRVLSFPNVSDIEMKERYMMFMAGACAFQTALINISSHKPNQQVGEKLTEKFMFNTHNFFQTLFTTKGNG